MKLSFNTFAYSSYPVWVPAYPLDYVIKNLAKIGYDGIELGCVSPLAFPPYLTKDDRMRINDLLMENKIKISSVLPVPGGTGCGMNVASPMKAERLHTIQNYKDAIDLAYDLGGEGKVCLYIAGWVIWEFYQEQAWNWSRECLIEIAQHAKQKGVIMAIEPTPSVTNLIETADDALKLMREVNMDNVKVMFDTIHAYYRGEVPADYIDKMGTDLVHIHISDVDRTPPGTYNDFKSIIDGLKSINYKGYITMEIGVIGKIDPNEYARRSYEYMSKIL